MKTKKRPTSPKITVYKAVKVNGSDGSYKSTFEENPTPFKYELGVKIKASIKFPMCCFKTYEEAIKNFPDNYVVLKCSTTKRNIVSKRKIHADLYYYVGDLNNIVLISELTPICEVKQ